MKTLEINSALLWLCTIFLFPWWGEIQEAKKIEMLLLSLSLISDSKLIWSSIWRKTGIRGGRFDPELHLKLQLRFNHKLVTSHVSFFLAQFAREEALVCIFFVFFFAILCIFLLGVQARVQMEEDGGRLISRAFSTSIAQSTIIRLLPSTGPSFPEGAVTAAEKMGSKSFASLDNILFTRHTICSWYWVFSHRNEF